MCGIVGYTGAQNTAPDIVLAGLRKLEYRGYDSAGLATVADKKRTIVRAVGRVDALAEKVNATNAKTHVAIGHTRWATHGRPDELNAHPHCDASSRIAVVHNGIIENFGELRTQLEKAGAKFLTETDTEVIAHLVSSEMKKGRKPADAVAAALPRLKGAFALTSAPLREAYEKSGRKPDAAAFTAADAKDQRGLPVWEIARWKDRT